MPRLVRQPVGGTLAVGGRHAYQYAQPAPDLPYELAVDRYGSLTNTLDEAAHEVSIQTAKRATTWL